MIDPPRAYRRARKRNEMQSHSGAVEKRDVGGVWDAGSPSVSAVGRRLSPWIELETGRAGGTPCLHQVRKAEKRSHQLRKEHVAWTVDCKEGHEERWPRGISGVWVMPGFLHKQEEFGLRMEMARGISNEEGHHQLWGVETLFWLQHGTWNEESEWAAVRSFKGQRWWRGTDRHGRWCLECVGVQLTSQTQLCVGSPGPGSWADVTHQGTVYVLQGGPKTTFLVKFIDHGKATTYGSYFLLNSKLKTSECSKNIKTEGTLTMIQSYHLCFSIRLNNILRVLKLSPGYNWNKDYLHQWR